jgi:integrase
MGYSAKRFKAALIALLAIVIVVNSGQRSGIWARRHVDDEGLDANGPELPRRGRPINPSNLQNRDHLPRLARLGLPRIRPHDLRHAHATDLVAAGVDIRTVADRLGHSSPSFTLKRYAHAASRAQEFAASVANQLLIKTV